MILNDSDVGVQMDFTIRRADGTLFDLTSAVIVLKVWVTKASGGEWLADKAMTIVDATNGVCRYTTIASDFKEGSYRSRVKITSGANVYHTREFTITANKI